MLGISFGEILIICLVGLMVIGPQRLPETARFLGHFFGRLQRQVNSVKADIRREMALEDMKRMKKEFDESAREVNNVFDQAAMGKPMPDGFTDSIMKKPADKEAVADAAAAPKDKKNAPAATADAAAPQTPQEDKGEEKARASAKPTEPGP